MALVDDASITMTLDRYGKHVNLGTDEAAAEVSRFRSERDGLRVSAQTSSDTRW
jgi:hypothetical protein